MSKYDVRLSHHWMGKPVYEITDGQIQLYDTQDKGIARDVCVVANRAHEAAITAILPDTVPVTLPFSYTKEPGRFKVTGPAGPTYWNIEGNARDYVNERNSKYAEGHRAGYLEAKRRLTEAATPSGVPMQAKTVHGPTPPSTEIYDALLGHITAVKKYDRDLRSYSSLMEIQAMSASWGYARHRPSRPEAVVPSDAPVLQAKGYHKSLQGQNLTEVEYELLRVLTTLLFA